MRVVDMIEKISRLKQILGPSLEIPADYAGLSDDDATEVITLIEGVDEMEARNRVAWARGENASDLVVLSDDA